MLIVARERQKDRVNALIDLTDALKITKNFDCLQWVQDCKIKWYELNITKLLWYTLF